MAEKQASYIQASSHPADTDRLVLEALLNPSPAPTSGAAYGVGPTAGDLLVVQNGTPNMSVNVGAGHVWIDGTESATQGAYHGYNDATKNLVVAASDPTNPRKDLVVAKVQDAAYSGATNAWTLAVVTGTPAASPAEPAVPNNAVVLAMINVAALATTVTNANITDRRRRACGLSGVAVCLSTTRPAAPYTGQVVYETDTDRPMVWDGAAWTQLGVKYDPPACGVSRTTTQSLTDATQSVVVFDAESYDTDTMHDLVTNQSRMTFKRAGVYAVTFGGSLAAGNDYLYLECNLLKNGATSLGACVSDRNNTAVYAEVFHGAWMDKFAANDYVECRVLQDNSANTARNLAAGAFARAVWLGRG